MHEKKTSNGVIRIRMNTCTILALIILPFLLFMLYVILFSECSDLLRKSGIYTSFYKFGEENYEENENPTGNIVSSDGIGYENSKGFNDQNHVNTSDPPEPDKKLSFALRIINLLFLLSSADKNKSTGNEKSDDKELDYMHPVSHNIDVKTEDKTLNNNLLNKPKGVAMRDASTQTEPNQISEGEKSEPVKENNVDSKGIEKTEVISGGEMLMDASKSDEQKDQAIASLKEIFNPSTSIDEAYTPDEKEKDATEGLPLLPTLDTNNIVENNPFFGPLFSYNYDSWDFSIPNSLICPKDGEDLNLLILIHSHVKNFDQRQAIRETWGRVAKVKGINYAFIVGIAADNHLDNKLKHDSDTHQDIIQTDLADFELTDTAKSVLSFKWLMYYCPKVKYVFKTLDNVFVNVPLLSMFLQEDNTKDSVMYGFLYSGYGPERDPTRPNCVTRKEFEGDVYPNYLASEGYVFPAWLAPRLFRAAIDMRYLPVENVFVTGILAEELKIPRVDVPLMSATFPDLRKTEKCNILSYVIVFHPLNSHGLRFFWDDLKRTGFKCGDFMDNFRKILPKNDSMYSNFNNDKLLYALLAGESDDSFDDDKENHKVTYRPLLVEEKIAESEIPKMNKVFKTPEEMGDIVKEYNQPEKIINSERPEIMEDKENMGTVIPESENLENKTDVEPQVNVSKNAEDKPKKYNESNEERNKTAMGKSSVSRINIVMLLFSLLFLKFKNL